MAKRSLIEQLDTALQGLLANPNALPLQVNPGISSLLQVAVELRDLPRAQFKHRLKTEFERTNTMVQPNTIVLGKPSFIRPGFHTITPYIMVREVAQLIDFVKHSFGARELFRGSGGGGGIHCEVKIGDSMMMLGGGGRWEGPERTAAIHLYVSDADAVYQRALEAGARTLREPVDQFYGDREACIQDAFGNHWYIATNKETGAAPAGMATVTPSFHPKGGAQMLEFLKSAFGADELFLAQEPNGLVHHAKLKIGSSVVELGEAHAEFQPMSTALYLYVEDSDACYRRAIAAGATSLYQPADQPYGDRNSGVRDPFGNDWYIGTHIKDLE